MPPLPAPPTRRVLIPAVIGLVLSAARPVAAQPPLLPARLDRAGDGSVGIEDLVAAVGHALDGCLQ